MSKAKEGDVVKVHYTGRLDDGSVFDSSEGREPLEFKVGEGQVIDGFDAAVTGMAIGDKKQVRIEATNAYGEHRDELVQQVERSSMPDDLKLEVGIQLQAQQPDGQVMVLSIVELSDTMVTLDANHPLAGKDLTFDISLVEIGA
jgi:peptidylprolyl isomerase